MWKSTRDSVIHMEQSCPNNPYIQRLLLVIENEQIIAHFSSRFVFSGILIITFESCIIKVRSRLFGLLLWRSNAMKKVIIILGAAVAIVSVVGCVCVLKRKMLRDSIDKVMAEHVVAKECEKTE